MTQKTSLQNFKFNKKILTNQIIISSKYRKNGSGDIQYVISVDIIYMVGM